jgi:hypothetical protein
MGRSAPKRYGYSRTARLRLLPEEHSKSPVFAARSAKENRETVSGYLCNATSLKILPDGRICPDEVSPSTTGPLGSLV